MEFVPPPRQKNTNLLLRDVDRLHRAPLHRDLEGAVDHVIEEVSHLLLRRLGASADVQSASMPRLLVAGPRQAGHDLRRPWPDCWQASVATAGYDTRGERGRRGPHEGQRHGAQGYPLHTRVVRYASAVGARVTVDF